MAFTIKSKNFGAGLPLICLPITKKKKEDIVSETIRLREMGADVIEWRVDAFEAASDLNEIRAVLDLLAPEVKDIPLIYTFRSKQQGGLLELSREQIYDIHQIGAESGVADLIDVELFPAKRPQKEISELRSLGAHVIASHHDFHETPDERILLSILDKMYLAGADIVKLAVMPNNPGDVLKLMEATAEFHEEHPEMPIITMSMGDLGKLSRISGQLTGSCLTFGNPGQASAPGQIPFTKLKEMLEDLQA